METGGGCSHSGPDCLSTLALSDKCKISRCTCVLDGPHWDEHSLVLVKLPIMWSILHDRSGLGASFRPCRRDSDAIILCVREVYPVPDSVLC